MAKKKHTVTKATAAPKKQAPAMYPPAGDAEWVKLENLCGLLEELDQAGPISHDIEQALHLAMDLAKALQRGQTEIDYGVTVDRGKRNAKSTVVANDVKSTKTDVSIDAAHAEYTRRMATEKRPRMKTSTLRNMAKMKDDSGNQIWKFGTLRRWARNW